jgi:hypothetical protein
MQKIQKDYPNLSQSIYGFTQFAEKLNGRIAMISFLIIVFLEYFFNIKVINLLT